MSTVHIGTVWPENQPYMRPVVMTLYLVSACTLAAFIAKRTSNISALRSLSLARMLVLCVLVDSFLFITTSAIILFGVGTSFSPIACSVGIWWCLLLYASSKIFIYLFLMERVYLVHTATGVVSRIRSPWYRISCGFFLCWIATAISMIVGRISFIRERDDACVIGLKLYATVSMLTVDLAVNLFLTAAFVVPIYRSKFVKARVLARNSSLAAIAALITSFANIIILSVQHGKQLSWVCLGSCGLDVTCNAAIIFCVTRGASAEQELTDSRYPSRRGSTFIPQSYFPGDGTSSRPRGSDPNEWEPYASPTASSPPPTTWSQRANTVFPTTPGLLAVPTTPFSNTMVAAPNLHAPAPLLLRTYSISYDDRDQSPGSGKHVGHEGDDKY